MFGYPPGSRSALLSRASIYALLTGLSGVALSTGALAQTAASAAAAAPAGQTPQNLDLGAVLTQGNAGTDTTGRGTASYEAPSRPPLNSLQPTSVVSQNVIEKNFIGTQSYGDIMKLTPSVSGIDLNGPGLMESQGMSIRGLQDGQFNVTFDGIPIGDSNDFTHHTTSFFMAHDLGQVIVDRGPGTAETIGEATFGGTVSVRTKDPLARATIEPYGEYGSFDTHLEGVELDSGAIRRLNGATFSVDFEHTQSDGALSYAHQERTNIFGKGVIPLSPTTTLTAVAMFNRAYQNPPIGATLQQIQTYGSDFAYTNDPKQQNYYRYNNDHITTDMEYLDLQSAPGAGFLYDGKAYTYGYYHHDLNGDDPNGQGLGGQLSAADTIANGDVPTEAVVNGTLYPGDVPGENFDNSYRSWGTIQRLQKDFRAFGMRSDVKTGVWYDHQFNTRAVSEVDISKGNAPNTDPNDANGGAVQDRLQHDSLDTVQPFIQLDVYPIRSLLLTGGLKYAYFHRNLDAAVNQGTGTPLQYSHSYEAPLPSFEARYKLHDNLSFYAQVAKGFLAPNLNYYYTNKVSDQELSPQETWNYQVGFAYQGRHLVLGGDAYLIDWQNYVTHSGKGANKIFYNQGDVYFKGLEAEATYSFDVGVSLFANAGLNKAYYQGSHDYVPDAPQFTANFGVIYDKRGVYASVIDQLTGGRYDSNGTTGNNPRAPGAWYDPYNIVNISMGYTFTNQLPHAQHVSVKLNLDNVTNQKQIFWSPGTNAGGQNLYYTLPGVSAFVSVSVPITL